MRNEFLDKSLSLFLSIIFEVDAQGDDEAVGGRQPTGFVAYRVYFQLQGNFSIMVTKPHAVLCTYMY
ncbi:MAG: hypothetical protein D6730_07855 [Bacteroidetes bacterium]|nr:MAG: hypothetical protein D6730_07855 [Bacteroidota bacterium]